MILFLNLLKKLLFFIKILSFSRIINLGLQSLTINSLSDLLLVTKLGTVIPPDIIIAKSNSAHSILLFDNKKTLSPFLSFFSRKKSTILFILFDVSEKLVDSQFFFF